MSRRGPSKFGFPLFKRNQWIPFQWIPFPFKRSANNPFQMYDSEYDYDRYGDGIKYKRYIKYYEKRNQFRGWN